MWFEAKVQFKTEETARKVLRHLQHKGFLIGAKFSSIKVSTPQGDNYCVVANVQEKEHQQYVLFFMKGVQWAKEIA